MKLALVYLAGAAEVLAYAVVFVLVGLPGLLLGLLISLASSTRGRRGASS